MLDLVAPWADHVTATCLAVFALALPPAIWAGRKRQSVPLATSVPTALGEAVIGVALLSADLILTSILCLVLAALWGVLAIQRAAQR